MSSNNLSSKTESTSQRMYRSFSFNFYVGTIEEGLGCLADIIENIERLNNKLKTLKESNSYQTSLGKEFTKEDVVEINKKVDKIVIKILNNITDMENTYTVLALAYESVMNMIKVGGNDEDIQYFMELKERIIKAKDVVEDVVSIKSTLLSLINKKD